MSREDDQDARVPASISASAESAFEGLSDAIVRRVKEPLHEESPFSQFEFEPLWIGWRGEYRKGQLTKVPYSPSGGRAKTDNPSTWGMRAAAEARAANLTKRHCGCVGINLGDLGDRTGLAGIDLDSCRRTDGKIAQWALDIVRRLGSYTEISPSETGLKIFFRYHTADLPALRQAMGSFKHGKQFKRKTGKDHPRSIELYLSNRYFAGYRTTFKIHPE